MADRLRLAQLRTTGLLGHDRTLRFGAINLIVGGNGTGKSEVLEALRLLATGKAARVMGKVDDVMRLAHHNAASFSIDGQFFQGAQEFKVRRAWSRDPETAKVSQVIGGNMIRKGAKVQEAAGTLRTTIGGWSEAWEPLDVRSGGPALRRKLILLLGGGEGLRVSDYVPPEAPSYLQPIDEQELVIDEWAKGALARAKGVVSRRLAQLEEAEGRMRGLEGAGTAPDTTPILDALERLRGELAHHTQLASAVAEEERLARQVADARARLAKLGAEVKVAEAEAALEALVVRRAEAAKDEEARAVAQRAAMAARGEAVRAKDKLRQHRGADLLVDLAPEVLAKRAAELAESDARLAAEIAQLEGQEVNATAVLETLRDAHREAQAQVDADRLLIAHAEACPNCAYNLREHYQRALDGAEGHEARAAAAAGYVERHEAAVRDIQKRLAGVENMERPVVLATIQALQAVEAWRALDAKAVAAEAAVPKLLEDRVTEAQVTDARAEVKRAQARREVVGEIDRLELDAEVAKAATAAARGRCTRDKAAVEAEIQAQEEALEAAGAARSRVEDYAEAVADRKALVGTLEEDRSWVRRMEAAEGQVLAAIGRAFEVPASEVMGAPVKLQLVDARGNPDCRILRNGVDIATLSDAELLGAEIAILRALGPTCGATWRPIMIDRFESVERARRPAIFRALLDAHARGEVDQVFLAGCPDTVEAPPGVTIIQLDNTPVALG